MVQRKLSLRNSNFFEKKNAELQEDSKTKISKTQDAITFALKELQSMSIFSIHNHPCYFMFYYDLFAALLS